MAYLYAPEVSFSAVPGVAPSADDHAPELSDIGRYGRYVVGRFVARARAVDQPTFRSVLTEHLGGNAHEAPVTVEQWPAYEHVNVQGALDVLLDEHRGRAEILGVAGHRHHGPFGIADLLGDDPAYAMHGPRPGNVTRISLPSGPGGKTRECLRVAVVLFEDGEDRIAVLFRGPVHRDRFLGGDSRGHRQPPGGGRAVRAPAPGARTWSTTCTAARSCRSGAACSASVDPCFASVHDPPCLRTS